MQPKKRSNGTRVVRRLKSYTVNSDNEAYKLKRKRNNDAVKKTRQKTKETALQRKENVDKLRTLITKKEAQREEVENNIKQLKALLLNNLKPEDREEKLKEILQELYDEDEGANV